MMTNELVGGLMSNVSFIQSSNSFDGLNSSTVWRLSSFIMTFLFDLSFEYYNLSGIALALILFRLLLLAQKSRRKAVFS